MPGHLPAQRLEQIDLARQDALVGAEHLFLALKALRKRLADARGIPAYIVFNDRALREMAERRPATDDELLEISGVGPAKLARYGAAFLELLRADS